MPFSFANAGKSHDAVNVSLNLSDDNSSGEEDMTRTATPIPDSAKVPKKKVAIILGYLECKKYSNKNARTIESTLFDALCAKGYVSQENAKDQKKISLMRSCRTDKGVHAAMQVVSVKVMLNDSFPLMICKLNEYLPKDIRVHGIQRTSNSFQARNHCDSRVYEYLMPTYILAGLSNDEMKNFFQAPNTHLENKPGNGSTSNTGSSTNLDSGAEEEDEMELIEKIAMAQEKALRGADQDNFRLSSVSLSRLRSILNSFIGTRNFHNYTIGKSSNEPNVKRFIRSFEAGDPFLHSHSEGIALEWIRLRIHGQSFMLHQIRKLVGMSILLMKANPADISHIIELSLSPKQKWNIPKAPGLGLLLAETCFEAYNRKFSDREQLSHKEHKTSVDEFKSEIIYPEIFKEETAGHRFVQWWTGVRLHAYDFRYLLDANQINSHATS